ncbi:cation diffusion facilitator family transporter [Paenibacillus sp. DMB20]|uniref:cation diffusion facilitator family transporter n=1 Tax=Paenibacillus sp. DMB20 TaxID=1642570 RepID=UPI00062751F5|nr:cation diffusion facilitator family transporter [Paenibacillus sp. DMB20]KKO52268.1 cation transporter [Paenibacillus sp. DMB20]
MSNKRLSHIETAVWTGIISDFTVALGKGVAGYFSGSRALMGDALHSAANAATLLAERLPGFGFRKATYRKTKKSASQTEPFISILFSVIIMMGGLQIAVSAVRNLSSGIPEAPDPSALIAVLISLAINEAVFRYQYRQSRKNGDNRHEVQSENHRFGLYSSLTVTIGVCLSMAGAYFSMQALLYMDSAAALIVSGLVVRKGYTLISRSIYGKPAEQSRHEQRADYFDTIQRVHGVITIEDLKIQDSGYISQVTLEVKVSVNPRITVGEAHEIADRIQKLLLHRFIHVADAQVIVVPYEPGYPYKSNFDLMDNDLPTIPQ